MIQALVRIEQIIGLISTIIKILHLQLSMRSSNLIMSIRRKLTLRPGDPEIKDDWIKGYHFSIMGFLTDPNSSEKRYFLRIMGISPNSPNSENDSLRMTVFFDVKTGEIVNASEVTGYDKDGRTNWKEVELKRMPGNK